MGFDGSRIDGLLEDAVNSGTCHGVAALVVDRDGVLHESFAGAAAPDTIFRNASMTKAPVTMGALQLVEQGRLDLDATVASVMPEFAELQVLDGFDGERPILRAPASAPTIRQLMNHTAGLGYFFLNEPLLRYCAQTGLPSPLEGRKAALSAPLVNDPGTVWEYGVNTDWLGLAVERVSGQRLSDYLAEHVYEPLGMTNSTFAPTAEQRARLLPVRMRTADGALAPTELDLAPESEWDAAGHGSYGTIGDYGRLCAHGLATASSRAAGCSAQTPSSSPSGTISPARRYPRSLGRPSLSCPTTSRRSRCRRAGGSGSTWCRSTCPGCAALAPGTGPGSSTPITGSIARPASVRFS
jgi:methyl acetate hydrolase